MLRFSEGRKPANSAFRLPHMQVEDHGPQDLTGTFEFRCKALLRCSHHCQVPWKLLPASPENPTVLAWYPTVPATPQIQPLLMWGGVPSEKKVGEEEEEEEREQPQGYNPKWSPEVQEELPQRWRWSWLMKMWFFCPICKYLYFLKNLFQKIIF